MEAAGEMIEEEGWSDPKGFGILRERVTPAAYYPFGTGSIQFGGDHGR